MSALVFSEPLRPAGVDMRGKREGHRSLYQRDFYAWNKETEKLLIQRQFEHVDWDAVAAELERRAGERGGKGEEPDSADDYHSWCRKQADAVRSRKLAEIDPTDISEELAAAAASIRASMTELLAEIVNELLAWKAGLRDRTLKDKINSGRASARTLLSKNPSLAAVDGLVQDACKVAARQRRMLNEPLTGTSQEWTLTQLLDDGYLPH